jgi:methylthioribulose-1-phosphate dehydratase
LLEVPPAILARPAEPRQVRVGPEDAIAYSRAVDVFAEAAAHLGETGRFFHSRGWVLGTSGNLSAVLSRDPLRLAMTASGRDKGRLGPQDFVEIDGQGAVLSGNARPSEESPLHLVAVAERDAGSVLHTHSVWATLLSDARAPEGGVRLSGWEMLKGLAGVRSHEHAEWVPIVQNSQDYAQLSADFAATLRSHPDCHAVLLRGHGLYAWGRDVAEARRHIEILEFLFEVEGRRAALRQGGA